MVVASVRQQPTRLGFVAEEPFVKTNKYLPHKFLLARYLTKWMVSSSHVGKVEEVESRLESWGPLCSGWHRGASVEVGREPLGSHWSTAAFNALLDLLCVCVCMCDIL